MFSGYKIIELASVLAGPSVGQFFAELGAEVIKVENAANGGDVTRSWKLKGEDGDRSAYFCSVNWGKKSININLTEEDGLKKLYALIKEADIVITSYKPGDDKKLQVDYDILKSINPKLIYGKITGFGEGNQRVGYDAIIQAEYGFMSMNGDKGGEPLKMPVALMDVLAAHHLKEGLLLALMHRMKTGEGSLISVSLADAAIASLVNQATNYLVAGHIPQRTGSAHPNIAPYGEIYYSGEQIPFVLAVGSDRQFSDLCVAFGSTLDKHESFAENKNRVINREALKDKLEELFGPQTINDIEYRLAKFNIPFGRIKNMKEVSETDSAKKMMLASDKVRAYRSNAFQLSFYQPISPTAPPELPG